MFYTVMKTYDGFGAQYQKQIQTFIFCKIHNLNYLYRPFHIVEHNYNNNINYNENLEELINLKKNLKSIKNENDAVSIDYNKIVRPFFENNIDLCCNNKYMEFIKKCFWENKSKNFFKNDKFNVTIHMRRENKCDNGNAGSRVTTPNSYYLYVMNNIREKYKDKDILFHIYSQGNINNFKEFLNTNDIILNIDTDICNTFTALVAADVLVTSPSSFSYIAALISDGEVYYKRFWHNPKKNWIIMS